MAEIEPIKITGLKEFSRNLRKLDNDLPKGMRLALNEAGEIVVDWAQPKIPERSGRAARSVKTKSTRTAARVTAGSKSVPYYPWLDFGGRVGKAQSVRREFIKRGRYIYPGYTENTEQIRERLVEQLINVAQSAGIEVDR